MPAYAPLNAYKRVPFLDLDGCTWAFVGEDWTGASFTMHIRARPGDTGGSRKPASPAAIAARSGPTSFSCRFRTCARSRTPRRRLTGPSSARRIRAHRRQPRPPLAEYGNGRAAEAALGLGNDTINKAVRRVKQRAAREGYAPGHFEHGVASGYLMGKRYGAAAQSRRLLPRGYS